MSLQTEEMNSSCIIGDQSTSDQSRFVFCTPSLIGTESDVEGGGISSIKLEDCNMHKVPSNSSKKREIRRKPEDKPKRPLSAYNLFFKVERDWIINRQGISSNHTDNDSSSTTSNCGSSCGSNKEHVFTREEIKRVAPCYKSKTSKRINRKTHGKIAFADLARTIGMKWKSLDDNARRVFEELANEEKMRYQMELNSWKEAQKEKLKQKDIAILNQYEYQKDLAYERYEDHDSTKMNHSYLVSPEERKQVQARSCDLTQEWLDGNDNMFDLSPYDTFDDDGDDCNYHDLFDDELHVNATMKYHDRSNDICFDNIEQSPSVSVNNFVPMNIPRQPRFSRATSLPFDDMVSSHGNDCRSSYTAYTHSDKLLDEERIIRGRRMMNKTRRMSLSYLDELRYQLIAEGRQVMINNGCDMILRSYNNRNYSVRQVNNTFVDMMKGSNSSIFDDSYSNVGYEASSPTLFNDLKPRSHSYKAKNMLENTSCMSRSPGLAPAKVSLDVGHDRYQNYLDPIEHIYLEPPKSQQVSSPRSIRHHNFIQLQSKVIDNLGGNILSDSVDQDIFDSELYLDNDFDSFGYNDFL